MDTSGSNASHNTLRQERLKRHWRQRDVADLVGTTVVTVNRWERGIQQPGAYFRLKLSVLFGKSVEELGLEEKSPLPLIATEREGEEKGQANASVPDEFALWAVPHPRNPYFSGREALFAQLQRAYSTATFPHALSGMGGIGKTQVALEYAYRASREYQAVFWVRAETEELLLADLATAAELLQLPIRWEQDQRRIARVVRNWLATHAGWLLIFDNVEDLAMVRPYIPTSARGHVLLTTRLQATGTLAAMIMIPTMGDREGSLLLLRRSKRIVYDGTPESASELDRQAAVVLTRLMAGLPLALDQAGAYIEEQGCSIQEYLERYQRREATLLAQRGSDDSAHPQAVTTTILLSLVRLEQHNPQAAQLLRLCAFLQPDAIAEELLCLEEAEGKTVPGPRDRDICTVEEALRLLRSYSLVQNDADTGFVSVHRLIQIVVRERMDASEQRHWIERAVFLINRCFPNAKELPQWSQCQRYLPQALHGTTLITTWQLTSSAARSLLLKTAAFLTRCGRSHETEALLTAVHTILLQMDELNLPDLTYYFIVVGENAYEQGHFEQAEAFFRQALTHCERSDENAMMLYYAETLNNLGVCYLRRGGLPQALELQQQALAIRQRLLGHDHPKVGISLLLLGVLAAEQGDFQSAETQCTRALEILERHLGTQDPYVANALNRLAMIAGNQRDYARAEELFRRALAIHQQAWGTEHTSVAGGFHNLAKLARLQGHYQQAEQLSRQALDICERTQGRNHPDNISILRNIAQIALAQGHDAQAEEWHQQVLSICEHLGAEHLETARTLSDMADLAWKQGQHEKAQTLRQRSLAIFEARLGADHPETLTVRNKPWNGVRDHPKV